MIEDMDYIEPIQCCTKDSYAIQVGYSFDGRDTDDFKIKFGHMRDDNYRPIGSVWMKLPEAKIIHKHLSDFINGCGDDKIAYNEVIDEGGDENDDSNPADTVHTLREAKLLITHMHERYMLLMSEKPIDESVKLISDKDSW